MSVQLITLLTWVCIQANVARRAPHPTTFTVQSEGLLAVDGKSHHSTSLRVLSLRYMTNAVTGVSLLTQDPSSDFILAITQMVFLDAGKGVVYQIVSMFGRLSACQSVIVARAWRSKPEKAV
jgi:hypothetical protein